MDDPEQTKAGLRAAFTKLLELDFDRLLLAHGQPIFAGGKQALAEFVGGMRPRARAFALAIVGDDAVAVAGRRAAAAPRSRASRFAGHQTADGQPDDIRIRARRSRSASSAPTRAGIVGKVINSYSLSVTGPAGANCKGSPSRRGCAGRQGRHRADRDRPGATGRQLVRWSLHRARVRDPASLLQARRRLPAVREGRRDRRPRTSFSVSR